MNTTISFSISSMISAGWQGFKKHWAFIIGAGIITAIVHFALQMIQSGAQTDPGGAILVILSTIFTILVGIILVVGWTQTFLSIIRNGSASWESFNTHPSVWFRYIKAYIWYILFFIGWVVATSIIWIILAIIGAVTGVQWLLVLGGVLAAVSATLTAIYFSVRYQFLKYAVLDYPDTSSRQIFKNAGLLVKGSWWKVFWFNVVMALVTLLGLICLVIGLVVAVPVVKLAETKLYTFLKEAKGL